MTNKLIIKKLASKLQAKFESKNKLEDYEYILPKTNRGLLIAFRDGKMTFEQFYARIQEFVCGIKYAVLDDFKELCPEWLLQAMDKKSESLKFLYQKRDSSLPYQKWEVNQHCFRSIKYHHKKKYQPHLSSKNIKDKLV